MAFYPYKLMVDKRIVNTLSKCLKIKKSDNVLIVTDRIKLSLARKFEKAAKKLSKNAGSAVMS